MELKKNPEANLEKKRSMLFQVGLLSALAIVLIAFEWAIFEQSTNSLGELDVELEEEELIPITQHETTPPPPPPPQPIIIEVVEDDEEIEEVEIEETEIEEDTEIEIIEEEEVVEEPTIFTIVEEMPTFPGGEKAMFKYLSKNIRYPDMAKDADIQGRVYVNFIVNETGDISDVKVLRGIGGGCDKEAIRVVKGMPKWKAGKQRGNPVKVSFNLPILFKLN